MDQREDEMTQEGADRGNWWPIRNSTDVDPKDETGRPAFGGNAGGGEELRRLAAIMFTDMADYTGLTQQNESEAMELLDTHNRLLRELFPKHLGREIKTIGDSFLVEFPSALEAVKCASEVQKVLHDYNSQHRDRPIRIRVGIHLGDVVERGGDLFGDAVNIASRIEPLAEPGGACISQQVFDQVSNKSELGMVKLEPHMLKHVDAQIDVYRLVFPWEDGGATPRPGSFDRHRVTVLPFSNISADPKDEYFADGLTDELITRLSVVNGLRVVSRTSVMRYKGMDKTASEIGSELRAGSILYGSVRRYAEKVRVTIQLIDANTDEHIWSSVYDRELKDLLIIQSEIAESVAEALQVEILAEERNQIRKVDTDNITAHDYYVRGLRLMNERTESSLREAQRLFREAAVLDSEFARAYVGQADTAHILVDYGYLPAKDGHPMALTAIARALELDNNLAEAHSTMGALVQHFDHNYGRALEEYRKAIMLNPSYATAHHWYATCLLATGQVKEAAIEIEKAKELDPFSPIISTVAGRVYAREGDEEKAMRTWEGVQTLNPNFSPVYLWRGEYLLSKSKTEEAIAEFKKGLELAGHRSHLLSFLGFALALSGNREEALEIIAQLGEISNEGFEENFHIARIYAGLGDKDKFFEYVQRAISEHAVDIGFLRFNPTMNAIRSDSRFSDLFASLKMDVSKDSR
jgi:adenylate cyclase